MRLCRSCARRRNSHELRSNWSIQLPRESTPLWLVEFMGWNQSDCKELVVVIRILYYLQCVSAAFWLCNFFLTLTVMTVFYSQTILHQHDHINKSQASFHLSLDCQVAGHNQGLPFVADDAHFSSPSSKYWLTLLNSNTTLYQY